MIGRTRWDDWILLVAVILFSGQCSCVLAMITSSSPEMATYMFMAAYNLSFMTSICVKTSFALSLNRCFAERWQRLIVTNITLAFYIYAITRIFVDLFFCGLPSNTARKESLLQCKYWPNMLIWWLAASIFNAVVTWIYILLPAVVIWTSKLSLKVKVSVSSITVVGMLSGVAAIFRVLGSGAFTTLKRFDTTNLSIISCVVLEMAFAIIATSMTNATRLPTILAQSKKHDSAPTPTAGIFLEEGNSEFIKLSPIICPQKDIASNSWNSTKALKDIPALEQETLAVPSPAPQPRRCSWSRPFGESDAPASKPARLTLVIEDISDDEDDSNGVRGSQGVKKAFTNV
ncbi:hypothetical protein KCU62_g9048, partial [Aureobasidium sp. EXF-3399]